jgi:16S rRNA (uracil1498-N3)-methyltransferase
VVSEGGPVDAGARPDPVLVSAKAMVFVDDPLSPVLTRDDAHHLLDVLRLRPGESVIASDGVGSWIGCRVSSAAKDRKQVSEDAVLIVEGDLVFQPKPDPEVVVAFVPAKGDRPEWVVQKLTELGVDRIIPIHSHRSVVRWEGDRATKAVDRLRRVAREASGQCRRAWLPELDEVSSLEELEPRTGYPLYLGNPDGEPPSRSHRMIAIGPEGGWDDQELSCSSGTVGLGPTVLRSETAALVAGTLLCALRSLTL